MASTYFSTFEGFLEKLIVICLDGINLGIVYSLLCLIEPRVSVSEIDPADTEVYLKFSLNL